MSLNTELSSLLQEAVSSAIAPGLSAVAFTREGVIAEAVAGVKDLTSQEPVALDTTLWFASASKIAVSLLTLILAERASIDLDSHEALVSIVPELGKDWKGTKSWTLFDGKDDKGEYKYKDAKVGITLRDILAHTSGQAHWFNSEEYAWLEAQGHPNMMTGLHESANMPRLFEAGTGWTYSGATEFLNLFVTRTSGVSFRRAMKDLLLDPLGIADDLDIFRTPALDARRGGFALQIPSEAGGTAFIPLPFPLDTPQHEDVPPEGYGIVAAAPLWGSIGAFVKILQSTLSSGGPSDKATGKPLLSSEMWKEAKLDSLAKKGLSIKQPGFVKATAPVAFDVETYLNYVEGGKSDNTVGWSVLQSTVARADTASGLKKGTIGWSGLANTYYFMDLEQGIGGIITAQLLPWATPQMLNLREQFERWVVDHTVLAKQGK